MIQIFSNYHTIVLLKNRCKMLKVHRNKNLNFAYRRFEFWVTIFPSSPHCLKTVKDLFVSICFFVAVFFVIIPESSCEFARMTS